MKRIFSFLFLILSANMPLGAVTPMEYYHSLVAGSDEGGFRDGAFSLARFHDPRALAFDASGRRLYVADSGNHRIRMIDLDHQDQVGTLAGTGTAGTADGTLLGATFDTPSKLASLPGDLLAVYDPANGSIRLVDLKKRSVSTLAKGLAVRDMAYFPPDQGLYFSVEGGLIQKLDLKTGEVSTVLPKSRSLAAPGPLCVDDGKLIVADDASGVIYRFKSGPYHVAPEVMGKWRDISSLAVSGGRLYALSKGGSLVRLDPAGPVTVRFPSAQGFLFDDQDHGGAIALLRSPTALLASPTEERKFYAADGHSVVSFKDYGFEQWWGAFKDNGERLTDFDYPAAKPPKTFRILAIGTSRNSTAVPIPEDPKGPVDEHVETPRVLTFSKRLELLLNTEAALKGLDLHFEVLNLTHRGEAISTWACDEVPAFVERYGIDLVLGLADQNGYKDYFIRPLTPEGVPGRTMDYEYMMRPLAERATSPAAKDLLARCKALGIPVSQKQDFPGDGEWSLLLAGDARMEEDLQEMTGRRLQLLDRKLGALRTSGGRPPRLALYYAPGGAYPNDRCSAFWGGVCRRYALDFFDLSEPFNALKDGYAPAYVDHFTALGNDLVALLLEHELVGRKLVPF